MVRCHQGYGYLVHHHRHGMGHIYRKGWFTDGAGDLIRSPTTFCYLCSNAIDEDLPFLSPKPEPVMAISVPIVPSVTDRVAS